MGALRLHRVLDLRVAQVSHSDVHLNAMFAKSTDLEAYANDSRLTLGRKANLFHGVGVAIRGMHMLASVAQSELSTE